ncbi:MAG: ABC transporter ATP-binding protein [Treponema sp.]
MSGLVIKNLCKSYFVNKSKFEVNKNISLKVENGSLIWIYGNSGAGKSTFLNTIIGIDSMDSGEINWNGIEINKMKKSEASSFRLEHCGLIFQFFELIKAQNIYNNVAFPLKMKKKSREEINAILFPLFEEFNIGHLIYKMPEDLSGGEKQRVSIVRSLSTSPNYIIADEITSSLDIDNSHKVYAYLKNYVKEKNGIGIFVSHDPIIKDYVDISYKMQDGNLKLS